MYASLIVTVILICFTGAQILEDYHEEEIESGRENEREPTEETERELQHQEMLRLAALQAELQEELRLAQYRNTEEDGLGAIPGQPGQDYPVYNSVPPTSFTCAGKLVPGYYADVQARCQVFHICDAAGGKHSFLCPQGSLFNQKYLVCDWWYTSECSSIEGGRHGYQHDFNKLDNVKESDLLPNNQYFTNEEQNFILIQPDIFQIAETGVPNRDKSDSYKDESLNERENVASTEQKNSRSKDLNAENSTSKTEITTNYSKRKQFQ